MEQPLEVSPITDFAECVEVIALPILQNGKQLRVKVRAVARATFLLLFKGVPGFGATPGEGAAALTPDQIEQMATAGAAAAEGLARAGLLEPPFSYGEAAEPGAVRWSVLHPDNQGAVVDAITRLSGLAARPHEEAAAGALGRFPADAGRVGAGG